MKHSPSNSPDLPFAYIDTREGLAELCEHLAAVERFAFDTEFLGERTYVPQLELVQVATLERHAIIDCQAVPDLKPLFVVMTDHSVEKVLHSGQQDIELFYRLAGSAPAPIFDTQVAAAMAGYGAQPGYANLVERLIHVSLEKTERLTDWSRRPLTDEQIAYAVDDVRYLLPLYERLRKRLRRRLLKACPSQPACRSPWGVRVGQPCGHAPGRSVAYSLCSGSDARRLRARTWKEGPRHCTIPDRQRRALA